MLLNVNFSSRTTSMDVQRNLEANVEKRIKDTYWPPPGESMVTVMCGINTQVAESSLELTTVLGWAPIRVKLGGRESCLYFHCVILHVSRVTVDLEPLVLPLACIVTKHTCL